jgi:hypothetical protein
MSVALADPRKLDASQARRSLRRVSLLALRQLHRSIYGPNHDLLDSQGNGVAEGVRRTPTSGGRRTSLGPSSRARSTHASGVYHCQRIADSIDQHGPNHDHLAAILRRTCLTSEAVLRSRCQTGPSSGVPTGSTPALAGGSACYRLLRRRYANCCMSTTPR